MFTRYMRILGAAVALALGGLAAVNAIVDPMGVMSGVDLPALEPYRSARTRTAKAEIARRTDAAVLLFGTSRVETCLDPLDPAFGGRPAANLGLQATNMLEIEAVIRYAIEHARPEHAILGLDLLVFGDARSYNADFANSRFSPAFGPLSYFAENMTSVRATEETVQLLLAATRGVRSPSRLSDGFNNRTVAEIRGPQRDAFARTLRFFARNPDTYLGFRLSNDRFESLRRSIAALGEAGCEVRVIIPPVHATQLALIEDMGHQDSFELWKRTVCTIVAEAGVGPLWDFAVPGPAQVEPIPPADDKASRMRWFLESSHAQAGLGSLCLALVHDTPPPPDAPSWWREIGSPLSPPEMDAHLQRQRAALRDWRANRPDEVRLVAEIAARRPPVAD